MHASSDPCQLWTHVSIIHLVQAAGDEEEDEAAFSGYSAAFSKLHNAAYNEPEPLPDIMDPSRYLAESIARYSQVCSTT